MQQLISSFAMITRHDATKQLAPDNFLGKHRELMREFLQTQRESVRVSLNSGELRMKAGRVSSSPIVEVGSMHHDEHDDKKHQSFGPPDLSVTANISSVLLRGETELLSEYASNGTSVFYGCFSEEAEIPSEVCFEVPRASAQDVMVSPRHVSAGRNTHLINGTSIHDDSRISETDCPTATYFPEVDLLEAKNAACIDLDLSKMAENTGDGNSPSIVSTNLELHRNQEKIQVMAYNRKATTEITGTDEGDNFTLDSKREVESICHQSERKAREIRELVWNDTPAQLDFGNVSLDDFTCTQKQGTCGLEQQSGYLNRERTREGWLESSSMMVERSASSDSRKLATKCSNPLLEDINRSAFSDASVSANSAASFSTRLGSGEQAGTTSGQGRHGTNTSGSTMKEQPELRNILPEWIPRNFEPRPPLQQTDIGMDSGSSCSFESGHKIEALQKSRKGIISPPRPVRETRVAPSGKSSTFVDFWSGLSQSSEIHQSESQGVNPADCMSSIAIPSGSTQTNPVSTASTMLLNGKFKDQARERSPHLVVSPKHIHATDARVSFREPVLRTTERALFRGSFSRQAPSSPHRIVSASPRSHFFDCVVSSKLSPPRFQKNAPGPFQGGMRHKSTNSSRSLRLPRVRACPGKYCVHRHRGLGRCDRCWSLASTTEREKFTAKGRSLSIMLTRGGCNQRCLMFQPPEKVDEVRLCRRCYHETHWSRDHLPVYRGRTSGLLEGY